MTSVLKNTAARLAIATVGAIFVATVVKVKPSQAAAFTFALSSTYGSNPGQGSLAFNQSSLTGVGQETATLSDLPDATFSFNYRNVLPLGGGGFPPIATGFNFSNPTFDFNDGNLVGINGSSSIPVLSREGRPGYGLSLFEGSDRLSLIGDRYRESLSGVVIQLNPITGQEVGRFPVSLDGFSVGNISFQTIERVQPTSVPEPSNAMGLAMTLGLVAFGQRELLKRQRKQNAKVKC